MLEPRLESFGGTERFSLRRRLGEGGFGVVYEALDRKRNAAVALKLLRQLDAAGLYRFKQEFRALADVSHPNLITLYELLTENEQWFFTMELIDGVDLLSWVREEEKPREPAWLSDSGPLLDSEATQVAEAPGWANQESPAPQRVTRKLREDRLRDAFTQLGEGILALHGAGMLHRDLKPSNVLVTREGRVVVLDFGLVAEADPVEFTGSLHVVGTPSYMAPEQASGRAVEASDWYSVGVMLYEALTGERPFQGSMLEMLADKQRREPPPPRELAPEAPEDLDALCGQLLRLDPAARPAGVEVIHRLGGIPGRVTAKLPAAEKRGAPLVGRAEHLAALEDAWSTVEQGRTTAVWVQGRSGMGKTALVRHFLQQLRRREPDLVALVGRCYEQESVPYKALDSLIDALTQYLKRLPPAAAASLMPREIQALARLFPVLREAEAVATARRRVQEIPDSQELRRRAAAALRELLGRLADQAPLVLFIDDLQWGDLDSAALLLELLRPPEAPALLLVGTFRSDEAESSRLVQALRQAQAEAAGALEVREVEVHELSAEQSRELALVLVEGDRVRAEALARESGGSPFFLDTLARHAPAERVGETTLEAVIDLWVARLPAQARRLLEVLAVAGRPVELAVAGQAAELEAEQHPAVGLLRSQRLARTRAEGTQIETYHDRIRETVAARLDPAALRSCHQRLAGAWEACGRADPETLAVHFQGAGENGKAATYAVQAAAQAAEALAFDRAARLYRLALELRPEAAVENRVLRAQLGDALANAGRGGEAAQEYLAAVEGAAEAEAMELERRAALQLLFSGRLDQGLKVLRRLTQRLGMKMAATPRQALLSLVLRRAQLTLRGLRFREREAAQLSEPDRLRIDTCWSVASGLGMADFIQAADFQVRHLLLALRAGDPHRIARALAIEAGFSASGGTRTWRRTQEVLAKARTLAERVDSPHARGLVTLMEAVGEHVVGRFRRAAELSEQADAILREQCTGVTWERDTAVLFLLHSLYWLGEWREMERRWRDLLQQADERGDLFIATYMRTHTAFVIYLAADDPATARVQEQQAIAAWSQQGFHIQHYWNFYARVEIELYAGEPEAAWRVIEERWEAVSRSLLTRNQALYIGARYLRGRVALARAAAGAAEAGKLLELAESDARVTEKLQSRWGNALAAMLRAGAASVRGQKKEAAELLARAEQEAAACEMGVCGAALRRLRGVAAGDAALAGTAEAWMREQGIRNPGRMTETFVPGRWR